MHCVRYHFHIVGIPETTDLNCKIFFFKFLFDNFSTSYYFVFLVSRDNGDKINEKNANNFIHLLIYIISLPETSFSSLSAGLLDIRS